MKFPSCGIFKSKELQAQFSISPEPGVPAFFAVRRVIGQSMLSG
jgi:hypothetical protein